MIGLLTAAALLLAGAGVSKLVAAGATTPPRARLVGSRLLPAWLFRRGGALLELAVGVGAIAIGGRIGAAALGGSYLALAAVSLRLMAVARGSDCGCFGKPSPINHWHTAVNAGYALVGMVAVVDPPQRLTAQFTDHPATAAMVLLGAAAISYLSYLLMTALPELLRVAAPVEVGR